MSTVYLLEDFDNGSGRSRSVPTVRELAETKVRNWVHCCLSNSPTKYQLRPFEAS